MQSCAVIGCGPAGIIASSTLRQAGLFVTCFELGPTAGGIWQIESRHKFSTRGLLSPLYPSMRCSTPKDMMAFSDKRFDFTVPSFPHYSSASDYLQRYASFKGVSALTRYNTKVQSARFDSKDSLWKLITVNVVSGDILEWTFDNVCVCTGQTQEPRFPPNLHRLLQPFKDQGGEVEHACYVKDFRSLRKKKVVIVGSGATAMDYCSFLHMVGAEVFLSSGNSKVNQIRGLSHNQEGQLVRLWKQGFANSALQNIANRKALHPRIKCLGPIKRSEADGIIFESMEAHTKLKMPGVQQSYSCTNDEILVENIDLVICATGFTQRYPFLHKDLRQQLEEDPSILLEDHSEKHASSSSANIFEASQFHQKGLYLGTIFRSNPSLAFIGLQKGLCPPFMMYECQSRFVSYAFSQRISLPSTEADMIKKESSLELKHSMNISTINSEQLNSSKYFDVLQEELGATTRYTSELSKRRLWVSTTFFLWVYHKFRSFAPLKRKKQHLLFSNEV